MMMPCSRLEMMFRLDYGEHSGDVRSGWFWNYSPLCESFIFPSIMWPIQHSVE